jgi:hypothetical protein
MAEEFVGNTRVSLPAVFSRGTTYTYPRARLRIDERGIVLSILRPPRWFLGGNRFDLEPIQIPFEELIRAEPRGRHGVRFHTQTTDEGARSDRRNGAIFSAFRFRRVRTALEKHGVVLE